MSSQLGRGVHNFGHKSPNTNIHCILLPPPTQHHSFFRNYPFIHKYVKPVKLGCPQLWRYKPLNTNISSQLGWGVHNVGHKSPYINISSQLGWGVHNFGHKSPYTNISGQLGWGDQNFGHKSPYK